MDFRSHKTFNAKIQAENWKHFFFNYKIENDIFLGRWGEERAF